MSSLLVAPQLHALSEFAGNILITVPINNKGPAADAVVNLYIFEGSWWPWAGKLLASYWQNVSFAEGEQKNVVFLHTVMQTDESRRDIGVEVVVDDSIKGSAQFDDAFYATTAPGLVDNLTGLMMMGMMMMLLPMILPGE